MPTRPVPITTGGFTCKCKPGYTGNGTTICSDINECLLGGNNCHLNATCTNTSGGFTCKCKPVFSGDGINTCNPPFIIKTATLAYNGGAGTPWFHTGHLYNNGVINVSTSWSNSQLTPSGGAIGAYNIPFSGCGQGIFSGTFNTKGESFTTVVTYCRSGNNISIQHSANGNPPQNHGVLTL